MTAATIDLGILDDYQSLSFPHFATVAPERVQITTFTNTLDPHSPIDLDTLVARLHPFTVISSMRERTPFPGFLLRRLPNLRLLLTTGKRNAAIDLATCAQLGIVVAGTDPRHEIQQQHATAAKRRTVPDSTTTHCWALILALARHVARDDAAVKRGGWQGATLASGVGGKVLGLCGLGRLGAAVGRIAVLAWGMRVVCWSSSLTQDKADEQARAMGLEAGEFEAVDKERLFSEADVLSVHYVLSERSRGIVGSEEIGMMKKSALLVNTSRGPLVDETALLEACERGAIAGVALDVFDHEPLPADSPWRSRAWGEDGRADVLLSPHMGYGETDSINGWYAECATNLRRWLQGEELSAVLT